MKIELIDQWGETTIGHSNLPDVLRHGTIDRFFDGGKGQIRVTWHEGTDDAQQEDARTVTDFVRTVVKAIRAEAEYRISAIEGVAYKQSNGDDWVHFF